MLVDGDGEAVALNYLPQVVAQCILLSRLAQPRAKVVDDIFQLLPRSPWWHIHVDVAATPAHGHVAHVATHCDIDAPKFFIVDIIQCAKSYVLVDDGVPCYAWKLKSETLKFHYNKRFN